MADNFVHVAVAISCTAAEALLIRECFTVASEMSDGFSRTSVIDSYQGRSGAFRTAFPPTPDNDNPFASFLDLFDDPTYPTFDASCSAEDDGVHIAGEQADPSAIAAVIQKTLKSALPCAIEWAYTSTKLRAGEFGGGYYIITDDAIDGGSTAWLARQELEKLTGAPLL